MNRIANDIRESEMDTGQDRVRDYDPYRRDARQPTRSGHYPDTNTVSRAPTDVKTLLANQQLASRRKSQPSAMAHHVIHKEGPNWILIAGGALVTAIGVMIVRKRKPSVSDEKTIEKTVPMSGKDRVQQSGLSFATTRRESTGSRSSEVSTGSPYSGDPYLLAHTQPQSLSEGSRVGSEWGDEECTPLSPPAIYYSQFPKGLNHSNHTVITPTSPPGSYRGADTSATECNDPIALSPPARLSFSSRRDMVHRLRQQLKSRDEMILDMQAQILDQEHKISRQQSRCRELEVRLDASNKTLVDSEHEILRLRKAVADYLASHAPNSGNWDLSPVPSVISTPESDKRNSFHHTPQHDERAIREARRLAEELRFREEEKRELERLASLRIKEHELVVRRLNELEAELEEARSCGFGKDLLLEAYEMEHENLEDKVDNLTRKLETKTPEKSPAPSMIGRQSLSGGLRSLKLERDNRGNREEKDSLKSSKSEDFRLQARSLVRSYSTLFERGSEKSPRDVSSAKSCIKTDESSSNGDLSEDSEAEDSDPVLSEKLLVKLQQEVEQLSIILGEHSDMISEKRLETSRLVDEFQRHNALISDLQRRMDEDVEGKSKPLEQDWESLSQHLSFSNDTTSAAQVQELSHKLEQIAKQQRVEEEIAELSKHQVKIAELKQRVEKLLNKCKTLQESNGSLDPATHQQASKMSAAGIELAKQLAVQEEQARRTSREVQRLSASFQLSSPYVPRSKKEELQKMLQDSSSESLSPPLESVTHYPTNMSHVVSFAQPRFSTGSEGKPKENGDILFDRTISFSSAEPAKPQSEGLIQEQFVYRPGFSGPSARKPRRGFPINSGSAKEHLPVTKRRTARGMRKAVSSEPGKELVRSDSNRRIERARLHGRSLDPNSRHFHTYTDATEYKVFRKFQTREDNIAGIGEWTKYDSVQHSTPALQTKWVDGNPLRISSCPISRRQSVGSFSDSSLRGHSASLDTSFESTKGSFGRFLFDLEKGNDVFVMNLDEVGQDCIVTKETLLTPSANMLAKLDLKNSSNSPLQGCSFGTSISGSSMEMADAIRGTAQEDRCDKISGSVSESSISIDSSFDALLNNTLDDLVRVCSTPSTPAETPESSFMSSQSESRSDAFYQL